MINKALRLLRRYHGLKQKDLAEKLDLSPSHLCEIEAGSKPVTYELLEKYSKILKIPVSSIAIFEETSKSNNKSIVTEAPSKALRLLDWLDTITEIDSDNAKS